MNRKSHFNYAELSYPQKHLSNQNDMEISFFKSWLLMKLNLSHCTGRTLLLFSSNLRSSKSDKGQFGQFSFRQRVQKLCKWLYITVRLNTKALVSEYQNSGYESNSVSIEDKSRIMLYRAGLEAERVNCVAIELSKQLATRSQEAKLSLWGKGITM